MLEEVVSVHQLWIFGVLVLTLPAIIFASYCFWPKARDSAAYRKKTDRHSPDDETHEAKDDNVRDSGIEASGEIEPSSERVASPEIIQSKTEMKSRSRFYGKLHDSESEAIPEFMESEEVPYQNGTMRKPNSHVDFDANELVEADGEEDKHRWSFPPVLDEFDLMVTEKDPSELEDIFSDDRLIEVKFLLQAGGASLGISIVGGMGCTNGDLPILIKRVLANSLAEKDGRLKTGDELVAVNETLLTGVTKNYAVQALSNVRGEMRLLVLQDD